VSRNIDDAWAVVHQTTDADSKRLVIYDDFLGQVRLGDSKFEKNEEKSIFQFIDRVARGKNTKFVMTTREYIFEDARKLHGVFDQRADDLVRFTLKLEDYTKPHRARVLFNHLFFSDLPRPRLQKIVRSKIYRTIVDHGNFNPRIVETICVFANTRSLTDDEYLTHIEAEFDNPKRLWDHPFRRQLGLPSQRLLALIWTFGGAAPLDLLRESFHSLAGVQGVEVADQTFRDSLKELDGNFIRTDRVKLGRSEDKFTAYIRFHNPSIRDFMDELVASEPIRIDGVMAGFRSFVQFSNLVEFAFGNAFTSKRNMSLPSELALRLWTAGEALLHVPGGELVNYFGDAMPTYLRSAPVSLARRYSALIRHAVELPALPVAAIEICQALQTSDEWDKLFDRVNSDSSEAPAISGLANCLKINSAALNLDLGQAHQAFSSALDRLLERTDSGTQLYDVESLVSAAMELVSQFAPSLDEKVLFFAQALVDAELGSHEDVDTLDSEAAAARSLAKILVRISSELLEIANRYDAEAKKYSAPDEDIDRDSARERRLYRDVAIDDIDGLFSSLVQ
jgi:hypothetical protein